jgi:hypothetical protein
VPARALTDRLLPGLVTKLILSREGLSSPLKAWFLQRISLAGSAKMLWSSDIDLGKVHLQLSRDSLVVDLLSVLRD